MPNSASRIKVEEDDSLVHRSDPGDNVPEVFSGVIGETADSGMSHAAKHWGEYLGSGMSLITGCIDAANQCLKSGRLIDQCYERPRALICFAPQLRIPTHRAQGGSTKKGLAFICVGLFDEVRHESKTQAPRRARDADLVRVFSRIVR